jgi:tol-pal system protein YbgF
MNDAARPIEEVSVIRRTVGFVLLAALWAVPALAQKQEIQRLQVQVTTLQLQVSDLLRLGQENQREIKRLTEALAEQTQLVRKLVQDQRLQMEALQTATRENGERLAELSERVQGVALPPAGYAPAAAGAASGDVPAAGAPPAAAAPPPRELYTQAYADYARGNYDLAIQGFQEYLRNYAGTDFADNAQYWIGECLYGKLQYEEAIEAWNTLLRDYSASDKLPDARVKKGMALEKLGRRSQAQLEYRFVVERFPNSPAARIAREKLNPQQ